MDQHQRAHYGTARKTSSVRTEEVCVGARVRVRPGYRKVELCGAVGTIAKVWGAPKYAAVEVRFDGGRSELLWRHQLEEIGEEAKEKPFGWLRWG